jgi:hypothetical protein
MKCSFLLILLFLLFSCNNSPEYVEEMTDTTAIPDVQPLPIQPVLSTEEKLSINLQYFAKEKIDSINGEDILEIVKDILETLNEESEKNDWEKAKGFYEKTESTMKQSEKGTAVFSNNQSDFNKIKSKIDRHRIEKLEADKYLKQISSNSRWEKLRKSFQRKLHDGEWSQFTSKQQNDLKQILSDWDNYKENNKLSWYQKGESNLEDLFFNYSKDNGQVKAAWGYMIQQVDWDGAVNYYTNIAPDAKAMGKPYYMLKYYYAATSKDDQFEGLYDHKTNEAVGGLCPPVH